MPKSVIVVGTGNAALCAAIAALEKGAQVLLLENLCAIFTGNSGGDHEPTDLFGPKGIWPQKG